MKLLDGLSPNMQKGLLVAAPIVAVFALRAKQAPAPAEPEAPVTAGYTMPSTDAVGTGQLATYESSMTASLLALQKVLEDLVNKPNNTPPNKDPGPTTPRPGPFDPTQPRPTPTPTTPPQPQFPPSAYIPDPWYTPGWIGTDPGPHNDYLYHGGATTARHGENAMNIATRMRNAGYATRNGADLTSSWIVAQNKAATHNSPTYVIPYGTTIVF